MDAFHLPHVLVFLSTTLMLRVFRNKRWSVSSNASPISSKISDKAKQIGTSYNKRTKSKKHKYRYVDSIPNWCLVQDTSDEWQSLSTFPSLDLVLWKNRWTINPLCLPLKQIGCLSIVVAAFLSTVTPTELADWWTIPIPRPIHRSNPRLEHRFDMNWNSLIRHFCTRKF